MANGTNLACCEQPFLRRPFMFYMAEPCSDPPLMTLSKQKTLPKADRVQRHAAVTLPLRCYCVSSVFFSCEMIFF
ncbi:MAG: hypothetical protein II083_06710, partial [Ruminococcus sp.]|nr:hypothetical protein [Ruminococcus sp.]